MAKLTEYTCRHCGSTDFDQIHRSSLVKTFFFWLPLKHLWCRKCHKSTYRIVKEADKKEMATAK